MTGISSIGRTHMADIDYGKIQVFVGNSTKPSNT